MRKILLAGALVVGLCPAAWAQNAVVQWKDSQTSPGSKSVTPSTPLPVAGTFSAGGFVPSLSYGTLTATATSSASTALPTNTGTVAFQNQTSAAVSCTLASGTATAATNEIIVPAGSTIFVGTAGYNNTACINQTGSASNVIVLAGGSGLGTGFGGGSSGSSSGGNVNITQIAGNNVASGLTNGVLPIDTLTGSNLYAAATSPVPCKAAATWNASTGLTSTQPTGCDGSAALWSDIGAVGGAALALGQTTKSASVPVTIATDQSTNDPCSVYSAKLFADFESTTSGGSIITAVASKKAYICSISAVVSATANFSLIEGTGSSVCTGGTTAGVYLNTGTTAANGAYLATGISASGGSTTLAANSTANQNICVLFTTTNAPQVNVHVSYVQQ